MDFMLIRIFLLSLVVTSVVRADEFEQTILPAIEKYCVDCHDPEDSKGDVKFLDVRTVKDVQVRRSAWRSVAVQLRNRTMPPPKKKNQPSDAERIELSRWIDDHLRKTACDGGAYAGQVKPRRLNRLEYNNTVQELFGVDLGFDESLPADGGTGEGFDNSGDALFLPPMLLERYLEAAHLIVDEAIQSPRMVKTIKSEELIRAGGEVTALFRAYVTDDYRVTIDGAGSEGFLSAQLDNVAVFRKRITPKEGGFSVSMDLRVGRGTHALSLTVPASWKVHRVHVAQYKPSMLEGDDLARQIRLTGVKPGEAPEDPREQMKRQLTVFLPVAFRRPVSVDEVAAYAGLGDRGLARGDAYEDALKLVLRAVLVSSDFLYRLEEEVPEGIHRVQDHELAVRLSYFLWAGMPDDRLVELAESGTLSETDVLAAEVDRLLDDKRMRIFAKSFVGQWLGTKDVGGKVAPTANDVQKFYTPEIARDMRGEAVEYFAYLLQADRSVLELIDSDYTFLTERLAAWYDLHDVKDLSNKGFRRVKLKDRTRGGVLGMGAVLAMTSHHKRTSPVLRGAWVFDTLIGEPVPPPPPDVPALEKSKKDKSETEREMLERHRDNDACKACHNIIDPIGFGLQHFDWVGKWRDKQNGRPVDARGELPTGQTFNGSAELKRVLLETQQEAFIRNLTRKMLAYALGRSLNYRDDCVIEEIAQKLAAEGFGMRTLIEEVVLSTPFRNRER